MSLYNTVLVPIDFSESASAAVQHALGLVDESTKIHLIHVLQALHPADPASAGGKAGQDRRSQHVRTSVQSLVDDLGIQVGAIHVAFGDPGSQIAACATEIEADLVVVSSHGHTGLRRVLLGSVAERTARLAPCPVLIIKPGTSSHTSR